jgi:hypothetical protein
MVERNIVRIAVTLAALVGWSQASPGASIRDTGAGCFARAGNEILDPRLCRAAASLDFIRGPRICSAHTIRATSAAVYLATTTNIGSARQNLCPRSNALVPVSYFSQRVW